MAVDAKGCQAAFCNRSCVVDDAFLRSRVDLLYDPGGGREGPGLVWKCHELESTELDSVGM